jgi:hypothetical protein
MNLIKAIWDVMNGKKLNTGTIVIIATLVLQKVFGIDSTEAGNIATNIMMGIGGITALIGYIDRLIKSGKKAK